MQVQMRRLRGLRPLLGVYGIRGESARPQPRVPQDTVAGASTEHWSCVTSAIFGSHEHKHEHEHKGEEEEEEQKQN